MSGRSSGRLVVPVIYVYVSHGIDGGKMKKIKYLSNKISFLLFICLITTSVYFPNYSMSAMAAVDDNTVHAGDAKILSWEDTEVKFEVNNVFSNGFNVSVTIRNKGKGELHNWCIKLDQSYSILNIWNAEVISSEKDSVIIKNAGYNRDISAGGEVTFGFYAGGEFSDFPENYIFVGGTSVLDASEYSINYGIEEKWQDGFKAEVTITNQSTITLVDWAIKCNFDYEITNIWNAKIKTHEDSIYEFENAGYNADIKPGEKITFGFIVSKGIPTSKLSAISLTFFNDASEENQCIVKFDPCSDNVTGVPKDIPVTKGSLLTRQDYPKREGWYFLGWYKDKDYNNYFDFDEDTVNQDMTLYARWLSLKDDTDSDKDGLTDSIEDYIGTDKKEKDTDSDGLSDYFEINQSYTNPLCKDTDGNGVSDGDEDFDKDNLLNKEEEEYGTKVNVSDTDGDGIYDGKEIHETGTDPLKADTDTDSLPDGSELEMGLDPLKMDTDEDGIKDPEEEIEQIKGGDPKDSAGIMKDIRVRMICKGALCDNLTMENTFNKDVLSSNVVGLVGCPVEITPSSELEFDEAEIIFTYDASKLGDVKEENLRVMWYDEKNDKYVIFDNSKVDTEAHTVSCVTTHFSTYLVVDKKQWDAVWSKNESLFKNVMDAIQGIGSGKPHEYKCYENGKTWEEAKKYCEEQGGHLATITSKDEQKIVESLIRAEGSKNLYWLGGYRNLQSNEWCWVNDEKWEYDNYQEGQPDNAYGKEDKLMIYRNKYPGTSGECFGQWNDLKSDGSYNGDTTYYYGQKNLGFICEWDGVDTRDSDQDGILDIVEKSGYMLSNGQVIASDPTEKDTDGDGLTDAEEMGAEPEISSVKTEDGEYTIIVWHLKSDPNKKDSDNDGLYDGKARCIGDREVAPADPDDMTMNVPAGLMDTHVMQQEVGMTAENYDISEASSSQEDLVQNIVKELEKLPGVKNKQELAAVIVNELLKAQACAKNITGNHFDAKTQEAVIKSLKYTLAVIRFFSEGDIPEGLGARILNFVPDDQQIAYHSQPETWQRYFGYNDFYDQVFDIGSNMDYLPIQFQTGDDRYMLWMWKGDYWNLNYGAEVGLYQYDRMVAGSEQYNAIDYEVPMTLSLYYHRNQEDFENIFSWNPSTPQWWITGFSGHQSDKDYVTSPNPARMAMVASVDLSGTGLFDGIYSARESQKNNRYKDAFDRYLIFDRVKQTVWILWYKGMEDLVK